MRDAHARWAAQWEAGGPTRGFAARDAPTGRLVGGCELRIQPDGSGQVAYWTHAGDRRGGYATRAVRLLCEYAASIGVTRLEAHVAPDNVASRRVAERAGFEAGEVFDAGGGELMVRYARPGSQRMTRTREGETQMSTAPTARTARTVVVSGAGTGIGRAVAATLAASGTHVTAAGRRREPLEVLAKEHGGPPPDGQGAGGQGAAGRAGGGTGSRGMIDVVTADVATDAGAQAVADRVAASGLACGGVVCAAGGLAGSASDPGGLTGVRLGWQASFESNVLTAVLLVEALRPGLERGGGRVVLLSSVAALRGSGGGPYGAMKAALHGWAYDLAAELGPHGGTANVVAPGFVPDTEFWAGRLTPESRRRRGAQTLVGREGTPAEVASLIAWLLGPDGGWVTGQVLSPNGGVVLGR